MSRLPRCYPGPGCGCSDTNSCYPGSGPVGDREPATRYEWEVRALQPKRAHLQGIVGMTVQSVFTARALFRSWSRTYHVVSVTRKPRVK